MRKGTELVVDIAGYTEVTSDMNCTIRRQFNETATLVDEPEFPGRCVWRTLLPGIATPYDNTLLNIAILRGYQDLITRLR
jgi:hypothetical protein